MEQSPINWGRPRDEIYGQYSNAIAEAPNTASMPKKHTQQPTVTGSSVIGIKFDKGVIVAADTLASYGSLARFDNMDRLTKVGDSTIVGIGGDVSDMQYVQRILEDLEIEEHYDNSGDQSLHSENIFNYLSKVYYGRRTKMNPLWNAVLVGGVDSKNEPFLSHVDLLGVTFSSPALATGFGAYMALPLLRQLVPYPDSYKNVTEADARAMVDKCMKVLFYRDARSIDKYDVATITTGNVKIEKNIKCVDQNWRFAEDIRGYGRTTS